MSYQVLARKWRPTSFNEVVGQEQVLKVLTNGLSLGRIHHAYLFSGTRGVGKTSIARLFAKGLNCEQGISANPCGNCVNCRDIEEGRFVDLIEIDAASRTKVEDTREILDNIQYLPTKGRFKVYLIDEVHMLSRSSFNALLKTLEEPPEHVKFLLATTDPQKLPITILSRCLHLHLSLLDAILITQQITHILQLEHIEYDQKAIALLAKAADGSMRDALSLTDQAIALGNGKVAADSVANMLGILDKNLPFLLIEALSQLQASQLMQQLTKAAEQGVNWDNLLAESIALLHQIALLQVVPTALGDYTDSEERIRLLAQNMSPNDVQLFYQILLMGRKDLSYAPDKRMAVEMGFLRALAFMPKSSVGQDNNCQSERNSSPKKSLDNTHTNKVSINSIELTKQQENFSQSKTEPSQLSAASSMEAAKQDSSDKKSLATRLRTNSNPIYNDNESDINKTNSIKPNRGNSSSSTNSVHAVNYLSAEDISEEAPNLTKNILAMRRKLIDEEQNQKKSKPIEQIQLKSKVKSAKVNNLAQSNLAKTDNHKTKVIESTTNNSTSNHTDKHIEITAENYQWQAKHPIENKDDLSSETHAFKESLLGDKTPEMMQKLIDEIASKDPWSAEIERLAIPPIVKQIAINAALEETSPNSIILHLRSAVKHLINSQAPKIKLAEALSIERQKTINVEIIVDDTLSDKTPIMLREALYQQKLATAKQIVHGDEKVALISQYFEARIDEDSIRPV